MDFNYTELSNFDMDVMQLTDTEQVLETNRLILEPLLPQHAVCLFPVLQDRSIYQYIPQDPPVSLADLTQHYQRLVHRRSPAGDEVWLNWAVRLKASGQYIGRIEASIFETHTAEIAYVLGPVYCRHGYATEACARIISLLHSDYGVRSTTATVDTRNSASIRLLERLGFVQVGYQANADFFKGHTSDEYLYRLLPVPDKPLS